MWPHCEHGTGNRIKSSDVPVTGAHARGVAGRGRVAGLEVGGVVGAEGERDGGGDERGASDELRSEDVAGGAVELRHIG